MILDTKYHLSNTQHIPDVFNEILLPYNPTLYTKISLNLHQPS